MEHSKQKTFLQKFLINALEEEAVTVVFVITSFAFSININNEISAGYENYLKQFLNSGD